MHIEVVELRHAAEPVAAAYAVPIKSHRIRIDDYPRDAALLDRLALCAVAQARIVVLDVAAELEPSTHERMQGEQHRFTRRVDHQRTPGEMPMPIGAARRVRVG